MIESYQNTHKVHLLSSTWTELIALTNMLKKDFRLSYKITKDFNHCDSRTFGVGKMMDHLSSQSSSTDWCDLISDFMTFSPIDFLTMAHKFREKIEFSWFIRYFLQCHNQFVWVCVCVFYCIAFFFIQLKWVVSERCVMLKKYEQHAIAQKENEIGRENNWHTEARVKVRKQKQERQNAATDFKQTCANTRTHSNEYLSKLINFSNVCIVCDARTLYLEQWDIMQSDMLILHTTCLINWYNLA